MILSRTINEPIHTYRMRIMAVHGSSMLGLTVSRDLARSTIMVMDYRADAWLNQIVVR
jgi:hypothetical protein